VARDLSRSSILTRTDIAALCLLFASAFLVRSIGLDWGDVHPDEHPGAAAKVLTGVFARDAQYYPPLFDYIVAAAYAILYSTGRILRWWGSASEFRAAYFSDQTLFYVVARLASAAISATTAPLATLLALDFRLSRWNALAIGSIVALLPSEVYWSHVAKSDIGLGPGLLLMFLAAFRFLDQPRSFGRIALLGFAVALSLSFKHSAVFVLAPAIAIIGLISLRSYSFASMLGSWLAVLAVAIAFWIPMNLGIVLNPKAFIDAQIVQSQMSLRSTNFITSSSIWLTGFISVDSGIPPVLLALWLFSMPAALIGEASYHQRLRLSVMAAATIVGLVVVIILVGERQPGHLWLPFTTLVCAMTLIALSLWARRGGQVGWWIAAVSFAIVAVSFAARDRAILNEAHAIPLQPRVAEIINRFAPTDTRILSNLDLRGALPISSVAARETRARHERLAARYAVELPPAAAENQKEQSGYIIRSYPFVIGGLENLEPEEVKLILPFGWPIQPEEWQLEHWLDKNYKIFIVMGLDLINHPNRLYRDFFRSIKARCREAATVPTTKPLFFQADTAIYDCRN
jgi:hypothetical protein